MIVYHMRKTGSPSLGHNGGPPLEERPRRPKRHVPPWGQGGFARYFEWCSAHKKAWSAPMKIVRRRALKAQESGVSYERYVLEILERGRYLPKKESEPDEVGSAQA